MQIIRPRINDYYGIPKTQEELDFAIPFLDEDIPLYIDPFLLWKSPSFQDNSLHTALVNSFNNICYQYKKGKETEAIENLILASECNEIGLGNSKSRTGKRIGVKISTEILEIAKKIPEIQKNGFIHFEEIQLLVDNISKDRISDFSSSFMKSFLIDFTIQQCEELKIPMEKISVPVYNYKANKFINEECFLPNNPISAEPLIFVPKRWLRFVPWITYEDYDGYFFKEINHEEARFEKIKILNYNRDNYNIVRTYLERKELTAKDCKNDPLFKQIPALSSKTKLNTILKLNTGTENKADKVFEETICQLLPSLLYPQLDFAEEQSRTDSGVQIRDLIFYNNRSHEFFQGLYDDYDCKQIVVELKNVKEIEREHINQLNRYLSGQFGRFGMLFTRNTPSKKIIRNTIDLWSGQRKCILIFDDEDLKLMCQLFQSKQRFPYEVIKKKYIDFIRSCPS